MPKKIKVEPDRFSVSFGLTLQMGDYEPMKVDTFKSTDRQGTETDEEVLKRLTKDVLKAATYVVVEGAKQIQGIKDLAFEQLADAE